MSSFASTIRSDPALEASVDSCCQTRTAGVNPVALLPSPSSWESPILPSSPSPSLSPSPIPSGLNDFEWIGFLPRCPANLVILTQDTSERWFVHREILKFTQSEELSQLAECPTATVHLEVPAGATRSLLEWIYPHTSVRITNFDGLDAAFFVATKYKLDAMRDSLRALFDQPDCPVRIRADPIRAYSIASKYGFRSDAQEAAKLAVGRIDLTNSWSQEKLSRSGVNQECAFRLVQRQLAWENALTDVLLKRPLEFGCEWAHNLLPGERDGEMGRLGCDRCVDRTRIGSPVGLLDWQMKWVTQLHGRLSCTPLEKCNYMFEPEYVLRSLGAECEGCVVSVICNPRAAEGWMKWMRQPLYESWKQIFDAV